jgi:hypothetical protein
MKKTFLFALVSLGLNFVSHVEAKEPYIGPNFSGVYSCKGANNKVGEYEVVVTLKLNRVSSQSSYALYDLNTETENALVYKGQAIASAYKLALTFNLSDGRSTDYSTGIADIQKISSTRWAYTNHYYEPDESGGDYGSEHCVMQKPAKPLAKIKKIKNSPI